jgi:acylphosphatase
MIGNHDVMRKRYLIKGHVQGVGFRFWAARTAASLGLAGTVRNRSDGAVEVETEGPAATIEAFAAALHQGPRHGRVDQVDELAPGNAPLPDEFRIIA